MYVNRWANLHTCIRSQILNLFFTAGFFPQAGVSRYFEGLFIVFLCLVQNAWWIDQLSYMGLIVLFLLVYLELVAWLWASQI